MFMVAAGQTSEKVHIPPLKAVTVLGWAFPVDHAQVITVGNDGTRSSGSLSASQARDGLA